MKVEIVNNKHRLDSDGNVIDAHGGAILERFGDTFYLFGVHYGDTSGITDTEGKTHHYYVSYSSTDLVTWQFHGKLIPDAPNWTYFRPHVAFNKLSEKYVLWFHYFERYGKIVGSFGGERGVAVSDKPEGPYEIVKAPLELSQLRPGDHDLYVDDDGTAYQIYTSLDQGHAIYIERLNDDYLSSTMENSLIRLPDEKNGRRQGWEAPAMFKRNGFYYYMFGSCTDRGAEGAGAHVYTAQSPLGPFDYRGNVNRNDQGEIIIKAQQCHVSPIETKTGVIYVWSGDRWRSSDTLGKSFQPWLPLCFDNDGNVLPFEMIDTWELDL